MGGPRSASPKDPTHLAAIAPILIRIGVTLAVLPLLWGLALPRFLLLDRLALDAAIVSGVEAGLFLLALGLTAAIIRLRRGPTAGYAFRCALDTMLTSAVVGIFTWALNQLDPRVPYIESFSLMCMQIASGWGASLVCFIWIRSALRGVEPPRKPARLPGIRSVFVVNAAILGLFASVALGVGSAGRAAGAVDRQRAEQLVELSHLLATAARHARSPEERRRVLQLLDIEVNTHAVLLPPGQLPPLLEDATAAAVEGATTIALVDGYRYRFAHEGVAGQVLWVSTASNILPPVRAPDDVPAIIILGILILGSPLAAASVAGDVAQRLRSATASLTAMGPDLPGSPVEAPVSTVPVSSNDEVGDLALMINRACQRFERESADLKQDLRAAAGGDRARSRFLAAASHELRTPLTSITGYCHLLKKSTLTAAQREDITVIEAASEQLMHHVDEILDLTRIEAGDEDTLQLESIDLGALARSVLDARRDSARPDLVLEMSLSDDLPKAQGDRKRIRQVLENLVDNALKFTERGRIEVTVQGDVLGGETAIRVDVHDTGPGIPSSELEAIFSEFHRVQQQRVVAGTGLGLFIARRIVVQHGGRLWADSILGQGSVFHVLLPATTGATP